MRAPENTPSLPDADARGVVVCGLGRLGQSCVAALKHFGVPIHGVDLRPRDDWEIPHLASLSIGDCRSARVLEEAHIARSRAVLLVTRDERIKHFDGTQPTFRQSPPISARSTIATRAPRPAAPAAVTSPAVPAPNTTRL